MVLLIIIPFLNGYFIGNINPTFSDKPILMTIFRTLFLRLTCDRCKKRQCQVVRGTVGLARSGKVGEEFMLWQGRTKDAVDANG